jgi:sulfoacetaldehyde dehydrogenase
MGVDESGIGDPESRVGKRFKVMGILRDVLRQKSIGVIEELPEKGIVKYAKPVGLIASLVPTTNPELTPPGVGLFAIKCRDAVIFSPHPRSKNTTRETVELMRRALKREGAPVDLIQCLERPSIPAAQYLMTQADMVQATGGRDMVKAAYSSGTPAYGVGAGNSTMVIDETADVAEAARNTRLSKTSDFGSGCSADGNLIVDTGIYDALRNALVAEGGHLATADEAAMLQAVLWDDEGHRTPDTIAISAQHLAEKAGFAVDTDRRFFIVEQSEIGPHNPFSSEKLGVVLSMFRYAGFDEALQKVTAIYEVGGKGHSCGIYSFDDDHVDRLARVAPVSRIMVRQPQSKANAGAFNNGMPMTSSLGCGTWGGNITSENIHLKHYMNTTWVSRPIAEDRPSEQELFGAFYGTAVD